MEPIDYDKGKGAIIELLHKAIEKDQVAVIVLELIRQRVIVEVAGRDDGLLSKKAERVEVKKEEEEEGKKKKKKEKECREYSELAYLFDEVSRSLDENAKLIDSARRGLNAL